MGWRVVIAEKRCKLEYKLGYLICRGEDLKKVFLEEIDTLIIANTAIAITGVLLSELVKKKINVIFCDENHNPISQLNGLYVRYDSSGKIREQLYWGDKIKQEVWAKIVKEKISQQALFLEDLGFERAKILRGYIEEVQPGDVTNREGHAAKVYFNTLFGMGFKRSDGESAYNTLLNYGYAVILSAFNREIIADGYLTQCGLFHCNEFNKFNLSCDLMEPFRVLVDRRAMVVGDSGIDTDSKHFMADILNSRVCMCGASITVSEAISLYCKRVFRALNECDTSVIVGYEFGV